VGAFFCLVGLSVFQKILLKQQLLVHHFAIFLSKTQISTKCPLQNLGGQLSSKLELYDGQN